MKTQTFYKDIDKYFLNEFENEWIKEMANLGLSQKQLIIGSRLRPLITMWGYLSNLKDEDECDLHYIAEIAVSIELIHKASLLIDDWVDGDEARHGEKAFHTEYSAEYAIVVAVHMVSASLKRLKSIFPQNLVLPSHHYLCFQTIIDTIYAMSKGLMLELSLTNNEILSSDKIIRIAKLETSEILSNCMLLGYYACGGKNTTIADIFNVIGEKCGYLFQTMNDLEAFNNSTKNKQHKGDTNYDIDTQRKNLVIAKLFCIANKKDKALIKSKNAIEIDKLVKKYKVAEIIFEEMKIVYDTIILLIKSCEKYGTSPNWCREYSNFMILLKEHAEKRLD